MELWAEFVRARSALGTRACGGFGGGGGVSALGRKKEWGRKEGRKEGRTDGRTDEVEGDGKKREGGGGSGGGRKDTPTERHRQARNSPPLSVPHIVQLPSRRGDKTERLASDWLTNEVQSG